MSKTIHFTESQEDRQEIMETLLKLATSIQKIECSQDDPRSLRAKNEAFFQFFRIVGLLTESSDEAQLMLATAKLPSIHAIINVYVSSLDK